MRALTLPGQTSIWMRFVAKFANVSEARLPFRFQTLTRGLVYLSSLWRAGSGLRVSGFGEAAWPLVWLAVTPCQSLHAVGPGILDRRCIVFACPV